MLIPHVRPQGGGGPPQAVVGGCMRWKGRANVTNTEETTLSIIIPAYNVEKYLPDCLKSLETQDFESFEVICVDDGSEDGTLASLKDWAEKWNKLKVCTRPHSGPGAARNLGLSQAKGKYICFMDSDDMLSPGSLGFIAQKMEQGALDILAFGAEVLFENDRLARERYREVQGFAYRKAYGLHEKGDRLLRELIGLGDFIPSACLMCFRQNLLKEHNILFPERLRCEDEVFCLKAWLLAGRAEHTDRQIYRRRVREGSLMVTAADFDYFREAADAWRDIMELLSRAEDESTKETLRSHLSRRAQEMEKRYEALPKEEQKKLRQLPFLERAYNRLLLEIAPVFRRAQASYLFPWHLFKRGERVIIYGAGNVGRDFLRQLREYDYVKLAGVADRTGPAAKIPGAEVRYPKDLKKLGYDAVLLAVQDRKLAESIKADLKALGIGEEKIRWDGAHYLQKDFYEGYYFPWLDKYKLCGEKQK